MKKFTSLFLAAVFLVSMTACGKEPVVESAEPVVPDLSGQWKQVNSQSEDEYQGAIIDGDKIEIYWVSNNGDTRSLYWSGSFVVPVTADEPYSWVSQGNIEKMANAILASQDDTKAFTYTENQITYSASAMGTTTTVRLEKEEWSPGLEIEEFLQPSEEIPGDMKQSGFDPATNQTISFWGIDFSFPSYFDVCDESSTDTSVYYYPAEEDFYCSIMFQTIDADTTQSDFDESKPALVESIISRFTSEHDITEIEQEDITVAGLSGWTMSFIMDANTENPSTVNSCFVFNPDAKKVINVLLGFDKKDTSNYDYVGDYRKIIETAKLTTPAISDNTSIPASGIRPEFKEAMDSYEAFFDEYATFMKGFADSDNTLSLMADYGKFMAQYAETMQALEDVDQSELSTEELAYYMEVMGRINAKLISVVQ